MSLPRPHAVLCCPDHLASRVYGMGRRDQLSTLTTLHPRTVSEENFDAELPHLRDVEVMFATWGIPTLTAERLDAMPRLKAIFYAAGTVKQFAEPALKRGIRVVSAWRANGIPVAEFTLAQILLSTKGYFANSRAYTGPSTRSVAPTGLGNFGQTVAILGAGAIGRLVIELLKPFQLTVAVFDPYLSDPDAAKLGVGKVSLEQAFEESIVVSNHIANVPATVGLLRGPHFRAMQQGATFINTGRGAQVNEPELIEVLKARPDLTALLDVTDPEPPIIGSPLWTMKNVVLSSHIAGSIGNEVVRLADCAIGEFERWRDGQPLQHEVTLDMLDRMA